MSELRVFFEARIVGTLEARVEGAIFIYHSEWLRTRGAFPLSILMPLSQNAVSPSVFLPWAQNLLPEGSALRAIGSKLGTSPEDVVGLLSAIGRDTAGALSVGQPGSSNTGNWNPIERAKDLERIINEMPAKPFLVGEDGVSMSLAGVQSKLGVAVNEAGQICIPLDGAPSTHILKPDSERLYGGVQNEAFCLILAKRAGLNVPKVTTGVAGSRSYLLVTRYDRFCENGRWRRLHQEDYCQALGKPPSAKYETNRTGIKGPTLVEMFALTRMAMAGPDLLGLLDYVIFNVLACNTDAHAKNYSLLISGQGFRLAPIYDVMCSAAWDSMTKNLAQKIAGKSRGEHLKRRHWELFARECGLNPRLVVNRVRALAETVLREVDAAVDEVNALPAGGHGMLPEFKTAIADRAKRVLSCLD